MSASWPGIMRGPRLKTPLLVLLLLLTTLTESVVCQDEEEENTDPEAETFEEEADAETGGDGDTTTPVSVIDASPAPDPLDSEDTDLDLGTEEGENHGSGDESRRSRIFDNYETTLTSTTFPDGITMEPEEEQELDLIMILLPVVLVILVIGMILCGIFVNRRWKQKASNQELVKDDPYLDGSSTEKVPMPMFEEDVPSVLELEMEELGQWMKKDSVAADDSHHASL